jgi:hypothetical protein
MGVRMGVTVTAMIMTGMTMLRVVMRRVMRLTHQSNITRKAAVTLSRARRGRPPRWQSLERAVLVAPIRDDTALRGSPDFAEKISALVGGVPIIETPPAVMPSLDGRTEPGNGIANGLAAMGVKIGDKISVVEAAQDSCNRNQRGGLGELSQFSLPSSQPLS